MALLVCLSAAFERTKDPLECILARRTQSMSPPSKDLLVPNPCYCSTVAKPEKVANCMPFSPTHEKRTEGLELADTSSHISIKFLHVQEDCDRGLDDETLCSFCHLLFLTKSHRNRRHRISLKTCHLLHTQETNNHYMHTTQFS